MSKDKLKRTGERGITRGTEVPGELEKAGTESPGCGLAVSLRKQALSPHTSRKSRDTEISGWARSPTS